MGNRRQLNAKDTVTANRDMAMQEQSTRRENISDSRQFGGGRESGKRPKKGKMIHRKFNIPSKVEFLISLEHPRFSVETLQFSPSVHSYPLDYR